MKEPPLRKKVATAHLTVGMYVVELDRPWSEAPFTMPFHLQGFLVRNLEELQRVQEVCRYVYIDPRLGKDAKYAIAEAGGEGGGFGEGLPPISAANRIDPRYRDAKTVEEELPAARAVLSDTRRLYEKVLDNVQAGTEFDMVAVRQVVGSLVDSVVRNPDALGWLTRLKERDEYSYDHSIEVCILALTFGRHLGLSQEDLQTLGTAALLQDIGKLNVPGDLLEKVEPLSDVEQKVVRKHVRHSLEILRGRLSSTILEIVANHHERFDGSGYPRALKGDEINLLSTICGIVDTYNALVNPRPYRPARTSFDALSEIYGMRYSGFPGAIVEHFIHCVGIFPIGTFVAMNTGHVGIIVGRNRLKQLKPQIMLVLDPSGRRIESPQTVDLDKQELRSDAVPWRVARVVDPGDFKIDASEYFV